MWPFTCGAIGCPGRRHCGCPTLGQQLDKAIERIDWEIRDGWRSIVEAKWAVLGLLTSAALGTGLFSCSPPW